jgi:hypothetical protein
MLETNQQKHIVKVTQHIFSVKGIPWNIPIKRLVGKCSPIKYSPTNHRLVLELFGCSIWSENVCFLITTKWLQWTYFTLKWISQLTLNSMVFHHSTDIVFFFSIEVPDILSVTWWLIPRLVVVG